jgi:hypothetical protein
MPDFMKSYYDCEGPLGLPMKDRQARALEALLPTIPTDQRECHKATVLAATTELLPGERADVSWISTEDVDRYKEVLLANGMDDSHYKMNPIVTLEHCYYRPPIGRSLWRKKVKDGERLGIKAKTVYPTRPDEWTEEVWDPDCAFALVKAGLLAGKSVGFITLESHAPTEEEIRKNPAWAGIRRVVTKWLLLEYACTAFPCNPATITEQVSKGLITLPEPMQEVLGWKSFLANPPAPTPAPTPDSLAVPFTALDQVKACLDRKLNSINLEGLGKKAWQLAYDKARGKI